MQSVANLERVYIASTAKILSYMNKFLHPNGDPHNLTAFPKWGFDYPMLLKMRQFVKTREFEENYRALLPKLNAEELCNLAITLIKQTRYLLDRLMRRQQERFLREGGIREQMYRARSEFRNNQRYQSYQNNQGYRNNQNNQGNR